MKVLFVRHAEAINAEKFKGDDLHRPLTKAGKKSVKAALVKLAQVTAKPDIIIHSEATRARETAEILHDTFGKVRLMESKLCNPGTGEREFRKLIKSLGKGIECVAVIGHEPDISNIVSEIVALGNLSLRVKKGACVMVDMNDRFRGDLLMLVSPEIVSGKSNV